MQYRLIIKNTGSVNLSEIKTSENLSSIFSAANGFELVSIGDVGSTLSPSTLSGSPTGVSQFLAGTDTLDVGDSKELFFTVKITSSETLSTLGVFPLFAV